MVVYKIDRRGGGQKSFARTDPSNVYLALKVLIKIIPTLFVVAVTV